MLAYKHEPVHTRHGSTARRCSVTDARSILAKAVTQDNDDLTITIKKGSSCSNIVAVTGKSSAAPVLLFNDAAADTYCVEIACTNSVLPCGDALITISYNM